MTRNGRSTSYLRQIGRAFRQGQAQGIAPTLLRPVHTFVRHQEVLSRGTNAVLGPGSDEIAQTDLSPAYAAMPFSSPPSINASENPSDKQRVGPVVTGHIVHAEPTGRDMPPMSFHTGANPAPTVKRDRPISALLPTMSSTDEQRNARPIHPIETQHPTFAQMPQTEVGQEQAQTLHISNHASERAVHGSRRTSQRHELSREEPSLKRPLDQRTVKLDAPRRGKQQTHGGMSVEAIPTPTASSRTTRLEPQAQERSALVMSRTETQPKTTLQIGTIDVHILPAPVTPLVPPRSVPSNIQTRPTALPALAREMTSSVGLRQS